MSILLASEMISRRRAFSTVLLILFGLQSCLLSAQEQQEIPPPALKIKVLAGESSKNNIRKRTAVEPVVLVTDERDYPLSGVMVVFTAPETGASAIFPDGSKQAITYTNVEGRATARGLRPNQTAGEFEISVDASFQGLTARTNIHQTNLVSAPSKGPSSKLIAILAIAGGAAVAGAVAASGGGTSSSPAPSPGPTGTTIVAGSPSFRPPQ
jgi:hypothetical protein